MIVTRHNVLGSILSISSKGCQELSTGVSVSIGDGNGGRFQCNR